MKHLSYLLRSKKLDVAYLGPSSYVLASSIANVEAFSVAETTKTGIVLSTGSLNVQVFTAYGLSKGAFLSSEAASSLFLYVSKVLTFREFGAMPLSIFPQGLRVAVP